VKAGVDLTVVGCTFINCQCPSSADRRSSEHRGQFVFYMLRTTSGAYPAQLEYATAVECGTSVPGGTSDRSTGRLTFADSARDVTYQGTETFT
jgi:hypothetical protein